MLGLLLATMGGPIVSINDLTITDTRTGTTASASYQLTNAGVINSITSAGGTISPGNWINPASAAGAAYEVYVTNAGDALTSGTVGSWLALSSTQTWVMNKVAGLGANEALLTVQIRRASTLAVLDTAAVTLHAERV